MPVDYAITEHVEGERAQPSAEIYEEVARLTELADRLGFAYAWFAEHHAHVHLGHVPHPVLYALHVAGRTKQIHLGAAVVCVNLHHPVLLAEQIAMVDLLSGGRTSIGVGSGSTAAEFALYGVGEQPPDERRERFAEILDVLELAWSGAPLKHAGRFFTFDAPPLLPVPARDLRATLWIGANSLDSARLAGARGYGLMLSNLRTVPELRELIASYRAGRDGGRTFGPERIAASAPMYVEQDDAAALRAFEPALEELLRENRRARPSPSGEAPPQTPREHVTNLRFTVGDPKRAVDELLELREQVPFTTLNVRPRWAGLSAEQVERSLEVFAKRVRPELDRAWREERRR